MGDELTGVSFAVRCRCSRHYGGRTYDRVADFVADHQGVDTSRLLESDVEMLVDEPASPIESPMVFVGESDDEPAMQVLVRVFVEEAVAEVSYRRNAHQTWGVPTMVYEEMAVVRAISSSKARHPSVRS